MDVVIRSFCVVAVAEVFDKTWFVALICALNYGKKISFIGGFFALALHVFLAAALGVAISRFFSIRSLCFSTAAVFFVLALVYLSEFLSSDASEDVIAERSSEAKETPLGSRSGSALAPGGHDHPAQLSPMVTRVPGISGGLSVADVLSRGGGHLGATRQAQ
eukprot:Skav212294  [mRNA]  locus=scaffold732:561967:563201:- [translate_table: standard]